MAIKDKFKRLIKKKRYSIPLAIILILIVFSLLGGAPEGETPSDTAKLPEISIKTVKDLINNKEPIPLIGEVKSKAQVDIRSESAGRIVSLSRRLGDFVGAGQIIAQIENSAQRAAVAQAQASLQKVLEGASNEDVNLSQVSLESAKETLEKTKQQQQVLVDNAYQALLNSTISATPDPNNSGTATVTISGSYKGTEQGTYKITIFNDAFIATGLENASGEVQTTAVPLGNRGLFISFSDADAIYNSDNWTIEIPNTLASTYVTNLNAYNSALETRESAIIAAENAVTSAEAALDLKTAPARSADVQLAEAALLSAQSALNKTFIKSPIPGRLTRLDIELGDFVSTFADVAEVASQSGLEVVTYITENDQADIEIGSKSIIEDEYQGSVSRISPAIDQATGKIEVKVAVLDENPTLVNGQSVKVMLEREKVTNNDGSGIISIPLSALRVKADGVYVFTLDEENRLKALPVTEGPLVGSKVVILDGLNLEDKIIVDSRGLKEGQVINLAE